MRALLSLVTGLLVGAALGYAAARLLAPQEGDATRRQLLSEAEDWRSAPQRKLDVAISRLDEAGRAARLAARRRQAELEARANLRPARGEGEPAPL